MLSNKCPENAHCMNTPGNYSCVCNGGYESDADSTCQGVLLHFISACVIHFFTDIDECATGQHNCSLNADCINGVGYFLCECRVGYSGDGVNCSK